MNTPLLSIKNLSAWYNSPNPVLSGLLDTFRSDALLLSGRPFSFRDEDFKTCRYTVFAEDDSFQYFTFWEYLSYVFAAYHQKMLDVNGLIQGFHFEDFTGALLKDLSTGNRKKVSLITAFALKPKLLLLDEPVNGLDFQGTEFLYQLIAGYKEYGTLLFSSHILESITLTSGRVLVLENGHISRTFEGGQINAAGVMWRALSSEDNAANMKNLFMLPFRPRSLVFSYVAALGGYTLFTKTAGLLAVALAVSVRKGPQIAGSILCAVNAVLMSAYIYAWKKHRVIGSLIGLLQSGIIIAAIFFLWDTPVFLPIIMSSILLALLFLAGTDAYSFYPQECGKSGCRSLPRIFMLTRMNRPKQRSRSKAPQYLWRYLFRYYLSHRNYLVNTAIMWGIACVLPAFFQGTENVHVMPVGFTILSLNTPICILLSSNPALERAVRLLPAQKRLFCAPYCLFIFLCNMGADIIFLGSFQLQIGGVSACTVVTAVFFALQAPSFPYCWNGSARYGIGK